jgi:hypothetical protein
MFQPGRDIDAMRVAVPSYVGFAYHPGAVESGLNGWAGGKTTARRVEWPWAHRGLATRPDWYQQGPGPELRWQELRASFSEAIVEGDVTLDDPIAPDDPHWVGRLWRAPHYWLLVGGHLDATALAGPLAVRLPELPDGVACAFEIDAATLDIADAHLTRDAEKIGMTVTRRFSVVLLPLPGCPPMARIDSPTPVLDRDKDTVINTTLFGPWNPGKNTAAVHIAAPGLELNSNTATLPAPIAIRVPLETKPGCYPLTITGDCLKLKRWIRVG